MKYLLSLKILLHYESKPFFLNCMKQSCSLPLTQSTYKIKLYKRNIIKRTGDNQLDIQNKCSRAILL